MYEREISKILTQCIKLAVNQYNTPDGVITPPDGYTQIASFKVFEILNHSHREAELEVMDSKNMELKLLNSTTKGEQKIAVVEYKMEELELLYSTDWNCELQSNFLFSKEAYIGFALTSEKNNIIAFRGTHSFSEWMHDAFIALNHYSSDSTQGKIHRGFQSLYSGRSIFGETLSQQIRHTSEIFDDPSKPCYITGHSLGGALAVLAATDIALINNLKDLRMYNYGGPRVGNPTFASFYNKLIPCSYRVVNSVDKVPQLPSNYLTEKYKHVGQEWTYLWETNNIKTNHYLDYRGFNYLPAVKAECENEHEKPNSSMYPPCAFKKE